MKKITQPEYVVIPQVESEIINHILDSQKKFISFLESKVKNREVAEDIFQTSVLKVLKKSKDLKFYFFHIKNKILSIKRL